MPDDLLEKYREWMKETGGVGDSKGVGVAEMLESLVEGVHCVGCQSRWVLRVRPVFSRRIVKNAAS